MMYVWGMFCSLVYTCNEYGTLEVMLCFLISLLPIRDSVIVAVNQEYIDKDQLLHLKSDDEVAIIPPISGG